jgi:hypothetical protein
MPEDKSECPETKQTVRSVPTARSHCECCLESHEFLLNGRLQKARRQDDNEGVRSANSFVFGKFEMREELEIESTFEFEMFVVCTTFYVDPLV